MRQYTGEDSMKLKEVQTSVKTCRRLAPGSALKEAGHSHKEDSGYEDLGPVITAMLNSIKGCSKGEVKLEDLWKSSPMAKRSLTFLAGQRTGAGSSLDVHETAPQIDQFGQLSQINEHWEKATTSR